MCFWGQCCFQQSLLGGDLLKSGVHTVHSSLNEGRKWGAVFVHVSGGVRGGCLWGRACSCGCFFGSMVGCAKGKSRQGGAFLSDEGRNCGQNFVDFILEGVDGEGEDFCEVLGGRGGEVGLDLGCGSLNDAWDAVVALELVG